MEILKQHKSSRVNVLDLIYFIHSISLNISIGNYKPVWIFKQYVFTFQR